MAVATTEGEDDAAHAAAAAVAAGDRFLYLSDHYDRTVSLQHPLGGAYVRDMAQPVGSSLKERIVAWLASDACRQALKEEYGEVPPPAEDPPAEDPASWGVTP